MKIACKISCLKSQRFRYGLQIRVFIKMSIGLFDDGAREHEHFAEGFL